VIVFIWVNIRINRGEGNRKAGKSTVRGKVLCR